MTIRPCREEDWQTLKKLRLAALLDTPTAFGVSHRTASAYTEQEWRQRAAGPHPLFWLENWEPLASHPHIQVQTMQWRA